MKKRKYYFLERAMTGYEHCFTDLLEPHTLQSRQDFPQFSNFRNIF